MLDGPIPPAVHRRSAPAGEHRAGRAGVRAAQARGHDVQRTLPVSLRENAVVQRQPGEGLLPLLRLRRRRRCVQVPRAAREAGIPGRREDARAEIRRRPARADRGRRRRRPTRFGASRGDAQDPRDRRSLLRRAARGRGRRARAPAAEGSRHQRADDSAARARLRAAIAGCAEKPPVEAGLHAAAARAERPRRPARQRRGGRSVPQPSDGADLPRHRVGHRLWRPGDGCRSDAEISELAGNADLLEGADALRLESDQGGRAEARIRGPRRRLLRFRPGVPKPGGAGRRVVRDRAHLAAGAAVAALHDKDRPELRPGRRGPGRGGPLVRAAGRRRLRGQRRGAGQGRRSRYVHQEERRRPLPRKAAQFPAVLGISARSGRRGARFRTRRQPAAIPRQDARGRRADPRGRRPRSVRRPDRAQSEGDRRGGPSRNS